MRHSFPFLLVGALVCACGSGQQSPETPSVTAPAPGGDDDALGGASSTLGVLFADAHVYAHLDGARFRAGAPYKAYGAIARLTGRDPLADASAACGFNPAEALRRASLAVRFAPGGRDAEASLVALEVDASEEEGLACLASLSGGQRRGESLALDETTVAQAAGSLILVGDPKSVAAAVERIQSGSRQRIPAEVARRLQADSASFAVTVDARTLPEDVPFEQAFVSLASTDKRLRLAAEVETESEDAARALASRADPSQLPAEAREGFDALGIPLRVSASGKNVVMELVVDGDHGEQMRVIGTLSAIGVHAVRRYLQRVKQAGSAP